MIGIVTRYQQDELTYAALQLAERVISCGTPAKILAVDVYNQGISPYWDSRVTDARHVEFPDWALGCDTLICMVPPCKNVVRWMRGQSIESVAFIVGDEIQPFNLEALQDMDTWVFPYGCVAAALGRVVTDPKPRQVLLPWCIDEPLTKRPERAAGPLKLLIPAYDSQPRRISQDLLQLIHEVLLKVTTVHVTLATGTRWSMGARHQLKWLQRTWGNRLTTVAKPTQEQRRQLFLQSDLTAWLARYEGIATIGMQSLHCGTPVIAWDIQPQASYLHHKVNGYLVPCDIAVDWMGAPTAAADWTDFALCLVRLLRNQPLLTKMRANVHDGLAIRRQGFDEGWRVLGL